MSNAEACGRRLFGRSAPRWVAAAGSTTGSQLPARRSLDLVQRVPITLLRLLLSIYRVLVSPFLGPCCRFAPSCSAYASEAVGRFGILRGGWMAVKRVLRCHPFHPGGWDPVV